MSLDYLDRRAGDLPDGTLVLLHGRGADEHDLFPLFDVLDPNRRLRGITVGGPLHLAPGGKHWYVVPRVGFPDPDTFLASYTALHGLLDRDLGLDWSRTIIGGFSQGTAMSYALALGAGRPVPAGLLALSGFIPTVDGWEPDLGSRRALATLIAHGSLDPVISAQFAHDARDRLTSAGLPVEYHETSVAHTIDPHIVPTVVDWLQRQVDTFPEPR